MLHYFLIGLLVLIILFLFFYRKTLFPGPIFAKNDKKEIKEGNEDGDERPKTSELIFFTVDWCPHCKKAKPEWEQLVAQFEGRKIHGYSMVFTLVDCTTETPDIDAYIKKYKIEGYPTVKLLKNDQVIDYDAKPTKKIMGEFLRTALL